MQSTNRKWQKHLRAKGALNFFLDRLKAHAFSDSWQHERGAFHFSISERELDDELTRVYFERAELFPDEIYLETTSHCNLRCIMCAREKMTRSHGVMDMGLYRRIVDEIVRENPNAYIHYYGIGDPLMDPDLFERLAYSREKGLTNSVLFTNGQLLWRNDNISRLLDSGVAILGVDLDGFSQETYGQIRVGGEFEIAKTGIEELYARTAAMGGGPRIEIAYQIYPGINEGDIEPFRQWCEEGGYEYKLVTMHTWGGLRKDVPETGVDGLTEIHTRQATRKSPCPRLWSGLSIAWTGQVSLCFQDADLQHPVGDLRQESIASVWRGEHFRLRRGQVRGEFCEPCLGCESYVNVDMPPCGSTLYPFELREDLPDEARG
ncbi:radical SAM/SPASM domain-containing protein [Desulfocurvus sp. DL9XJH121]